jgi:hypothetical protein
MVRNVMTIRTAALILTLVALLCSSPCLAQNVIARDGWEAFPLVTYMGGDTTFTFKPGLKPMMLVLTDDALSFHQCIGNACYDRKDKLPYVAKPVYSIPLAAITKIANASQYAGADMAGKLFLGGLAPERTDNTFGIVYETATSAEAPLFKAKDRAVVDALDAKLRYRLKKRGIALTDR